jgi:eukaryotic-like serine/threonine-protein kinase
VRPEASPAPIDITPGAMRPPSPALGLRQRLRAAAGPLAAPSAFGQRLRDAMRVDGSPAASSAGGPRRRIRVAGAGLAVLIAGGVGYAVFSQAGGGAAPEPRASASGPPVVAGRFEAQPGADRVSRSYSRPPADNPSSAARTSAAAATRPAATKPVAAPRRSTSPAAAGTAQHRPPAGAEPTDQGSPEALDPGQGGQRFLVATFTHTDESGPHGTSTYTGTVRVDNVGDSAVDGWRVGLTVPGGGSLSVSGARSDQHHDHVEFSPFDDAGTMSPGDSVTFTFTVHRAHSEEPSDCTIDDRPCD